MTTLAFDGRMGASGDMLLGALLAAGADRDALAPVEDALDCAYEVGATTKNGIAATTVAVRLADGSTDSGDEVHHDHGEHTAAHDHEHGGHSHHDHQDDYDQHDHHDHHDDYDDHDDHRHAEGHGPTRTYEEVVEIVEGMGLPGDVEADARAIFEILGEAEATVHGVDLSETHFHEVGADDAIADVVGACLLLADLDPDRVVTTPVSGGGGTVEMHHGTYPVPAPAVVEIAGRADWTLAGGPLETELLTPTGAAILAHVADGVETLPPIRVTESGYGAGTKEFPDHPNVLRVLVGEETGRLVREDVAVLETNVDDVSPEVLGGLQETLADAGARDVSIVPLTMKKSRPGHLVTVVARPEDAERVARRLAEETGTLGVRQAGATHRWIARREFETVAVEVDGREFEVDVKVATDDDGTIFDVSAEYDDAAAVARDVDVPVREVLRRAENAARDRD